MQIKRRIRAPASSCWSQCSALRAAAGLYVRARLTRSLRVQSVVLKQSLGFVTYELHPLPWDTSRLTVGTRAGLNLQVSTAYAVNPVKFQLVKTPPAIKIRFRLFIWARGGDCTARFTEGKNELWSYFISMSYPKSHGPRNKLQCHLIRALVPLRPTAPSAICLSQSE